MTTLHWPGDRGDERPGAAALARRFFWAHPEWWCVGGAGIALAAMVAFGLRHRGHAQCACASMSDAQTWLHWMLMVAAMMVPLSLGAVRHAAFRSLRERRHRAMAIFLIGYGAPWAALGLVSVAIRALPWAGRPIAPAAAFAVAALWAMAPLRKRALLACHRTLPLAPRGWRADADCLRFGAVVGGACAATCWATMLACAVAGHSLLAMSGGTAIGALERLSFRSPARAVALATLGLATVIGVATRIGPG